MSALLKEEVDFPEMVQANVRSWKQKSNVNMKGQQAVKTTTRFIKFKDGTEDTLVKEETRKIDL